MDIADTESTGDAPLLDLNEASIKKLISRAKKRGYITYDELNEALPQDQMSSEQIEDVMAAINEMGVNIIENEEAAEEPEEEIEAVDQVESTGEPVAERKLSVGERTDDPVRMYLREMGAVELLSREGEIAIAKRIEAGRDTMIVGLCESPITFNAIIDWSAALNEGTMQLREIIDLEAMLSKDPAPENLTDDDEDVDGEITEKAAGPTFKDEDDVVESPVQEIDDEEEGLRDERAKPMVEDDEEDNALSLAQMEDQLKPDALEKFARITDLYKKFSKLQVARIEALGLGSDFPAGEERKYQKLRENLTAEVESVQFHATKIEYLVDQLYSFNRRLTALGGQMLRLAERHKVPRKAFLDSYINHELDENWLDSARGKDKKWAAFAQNESAAVDRIR
ncbi:MAG: RNA polymerase sigma factor RpoD, partial [Alphaproteobacteria bacterium]|nr:RNA polymerase sigma factor RpoD [Alphaproteobacteria bacterium]